MTEPYLAQAESVLTEHGVEPGRGLSGKEARRRLSRHGPNSLRRKPRRSAFRILLDQVESPMTMLLAAAAGVALLMVDLAEAAAILVVIVINSAIGFFTELKATRSMEALYSLGKAMARVRRGGRILEIPAERLVPGDIVIVEGGDVVTADMRLFQASRLQADESALTGESVPVGKSIEPVEEGAPLAERSCILYKGTAVTRGSGEGVVTATGLASELGKISSLVEKTGETATPLERRLESFGKKLIWVALGLAAALAVIGVAAGRETGLMLETVIALAVAAVPEGLPVVATIALARGMWRMARRNALINRLSAVETLGGVEVILVDKTGTLTENRMSVARLSLPSGEYEAKDGKFEKGGETVDTSEGAALREALEIGALCNNAEWGAQEEGGRPRVVGDPLEAALLEAASWAGIDRAGLIRAMPEEREEAFDTAARMMATFHRAEGAFRVAVKGGPEEVLAASARIRDGEGERALGEDERREWLERNEAMARGGLRVLALAAKNVDDVNAGPYDDLVFLGLVGLADPPRKGVRDALEKCGTAGVRVVMATGDQPETARHIARAVGLTDMEDAAVISGRDIRPLENLSEKERERLRAASILARVSPEQKLDLVDIHQRGGATVAMTGDGVNDAPALKKADIGIAMGLRGTQVAREAADMTLKDDAFESIVAAIEQGRVIFDNIRKFVLYLLSCNVSEVFVVAIATVMNAPLPILPLQILFLNLVTDVFPALALGVGPGDPAIMRRPPRPAGEDILTRGHWAAIMGYGALITAATLGAFAFALARPGMDESGAVTVAFLTLAFSQLWNVFNMRSKESGLFLNDITRNPWVWGALGLCAALLAAAVYVPRLSAALSAPPPDAVGWLAVMGFSALPFILGQGWIFLSGRLRRPAARTAAGR
ncbi:MAG: cation-translocating P-type ATPase [Candidatus Nitrospinota bacterium M3_3B_026]